MARQAGARFRRPPAGEDEALARLVDLLGVVWRLRDDDRCPCVRKQTLDSMTGDLLFSAVNVARKHGLDPDLCLRRTIIKFRRRFAAVEQALGKRLEGASLEEMERLWQAAALDEQGM